MLTGSHTALSLLDEGYKVVIIDNFDNAFPECYNRMQKLAGSKAENMSLIKARLAWRLSARPLA
jgi:UDP-glucose 4-epimerase